TTACVSAGQKGKVSCIARETLVWCGVSAIREVYRQIDPEVTASANYSDGSLVHPNSVVLELDGKAASLLMGERVALNLAQRMSGIATLAARYVAQLPEKSCTRVVDTRKTTPGLRAIERYAVRCGGAHNHREDLSSAVLIKDNHIAAAGSVSRAIFRARQYAPHTSRIECEVDTLMQLDEALDAGADMVLLDNFSTEDLMEGVRRCRGKAIVEASGGVTISQVAAIAATGVDVISAGALTHSARAIDLGFDWSLEADLDSGRDARTSVR
ncbi:MAG: carboxylating nicotinate-nucleotide diphosphorylase, partial [Myxococcota bacterium]